MWVPDLRGYGTNDKDSKVLRSTRGLRVKGPIYGNYLQALMPQMQK